jgi:hypothetical protein
MFSGTHQVWMALLGQKNVMPGLMAVTWSQSTLNNSLFLLITNFFFGRGGNS